MSSSRNLLICGCQLVSLAFGPLASAVPQPRAIIAHADRARGDSAGCVWDVTVQQRKLGETKSADYRVYGKGFNSLVDFISPPKTRGRKLLMVDRNMWFVKPHLSRPVPISPRQRLLGSASNGDLASTDYADNYEIVKMDSSQLGGVSVFVFDLKANSNKATYERVRYWVSQSDMLGLRADFYTLSGKLLKRATFKYDNRVSSNGKQRPFVSLMTIREPDAPQAVTTLTFRNVRLEAIPDTKFNINLLRR